MPAKRNRSALPPSDPPASPPKRYRVYWPPWRAYIVVGFAVGAKVADIIYGLRVQELASYATDRLGPSDYRGINGAAIILGVLVYAGYFAAAQVATYSPDSERKPNSTHIRRGRAVAHRVTSVVVPMMVIVISLSLVYFHAYDETVKFGTVAWQKLTNPKPLTTGSIRRPQPETKDTTVMEDLEAWWRKNVKEPPPRDRPRD